MRVTVYVGKYWILKCFIGSGVFSSVLHAISGRLSSFATELNTLLFLELHTMMEGRLARDKYFTRDFFSTFWQTFFTKIYCCVFSHRILWYVSSWTKAIFTNTPRRPHIRYYIISPINQYCSIREAMFPRESRYDFVRRLLECSYRFQFSRSFFSTNFLKPKKVNRTTAVRVRILSHRSESIDAAHVWTAAVAAAITNTCFS